MKTVKKTWYIVEESILLDPGNEDCKEKWYIVEESILLDPGYEDCKENMVYRRRINSA